MSRQPHAVLVVAALFGCSEYQYADLGGLDVYTQAGEGVQSDILFVVDDSASMTEEEDRLQAAFTSFSEVLGDTWTDWRLAVTTTDPDRCDLILGPVLTADTPDLDQAFSDQVEVGTQGSRDERGLECARDAVMNAGSVFLRHEADLHVVVFSDEDDHSPGTVDTYLDALRREAGQGDLHVSAVVGDLPGGCASGTSAADPGTRYIQAADETGGLVDSICSDDYAAILTRIGLDVAGLHTTFELTHLPQPDTIEVWVDGVEIPERDIDGWQYDVGENAVVFAGRAIPRPGMKVQIAYDLASGG